MCNRLVVIRGGGDLGSGVALRLWRSGFRVVILEAPKPIAVRRAVALAEAVYDECASVEEMVGRRVRTPEDGLEQAQRGVVPVLVDSTAGSLPELRPYGVVDAIMAKRNTGTSTMMAERVIGLGPGFTAPRDVHAVVETNRGPHLGRVIWEGSAERNTGEPGTVAGHAGARVLRAPRNGRLADAVTIGDVVEAGEIVATVAGEPVRAAFRGVVRGLARDGLDVHAGMKIGDIDPRIDPALCRLVSDKALAVAGGVLEAILSRQGTGK